MNEATDLLYSLVKIPSVSGNEKQIGEYLANRLKKNFRVRKQKVGSRFNLLAVKGKPTIVFTAHMDTVPNCPKPKIADGWLYGRGACDTKASIASMVVAAEKAAREGIKDFGLLFDVSEETDFSGIKKAVNLANPKFVIVGEPTNLKPVIGQKGLLGFKVICKGKAANGSTPEKGKNAIEMLMTELTKLKSMKFSSGTTCNIGKISGGTQANVVPDYAEASVEIRTIPKDADAYIRIKRKLKGTKLLCDFEPKMLQDNELLNLFKRGSIVPYFTEMYFWKKAVVIGPGNLAYAHTEKEKIKVCEVETAVEIYLQLLRKWGK